MVVCICNAVSDTHIRACVERGARTLKDVRETLGVGLACGVCAKTARQLVREVAAQFRATEPAPAQPRNAPPAAARDAAAFQSNHVRRQA